MTSLYFEVQRICSCIISAREFFLHSEALLTMTWMLDHASRKVQAEARRFMEGLRTFGGSIAPPLGEPLLTTSGQRSMLV